MEEAFRMFFSKYDGVDAIDEQGMKDLFFAGAFSVVVFLKAAKKTKNKNASDAIADELMKNASDAIVDELMNWSKSYLKP
jgi:DNA polymerase III delta subunit